MIRPGRGLVLALLLAMPALAQDTPAEAISTEVFGPRNPVDYAFGAYQRGYFLTALELALPRAEKGDAAAQTLIAELYARASGSHRTPNAPPAGTSSRPRTATGWPSSSSA